MGKFLGRVWAEFGMTLWAIGGSFWASIETNFGPILEPIQGRFSARFYADFRANFEADFGLVVRPILE
jgi:hypothetical protein